MTEAHHIHMRNWQAVDDRWLEAASVNHCENIEQQPFREFKLTYQTGKGTNHLVPVLFPSDIVTATQKLCNSTVQNSCVTHDMNAHVFPNTKQSLDHVSGWHSVHRVSMDAKIECPELRNLTKMRHLISTVCS